LSCVNKKGGTLSGLKKGVQKTLRYGKIKEEEVTPNRNQRIWEVDKTLMGRTKANNPENNFEEVLLLNGEIWLIRSHLITPPHYKSSIIIGSTI